MIVATATTRMEIFEVVALPCVPPDHATARVRPANLDAWPLIPWPTVVAGHRSAADRPPP